MSNSEFSEHSDKDLSTDAVTEIANRICEEKGWKSFGDVLIKKLNGDLYVRSRQGRSGLIPVVIINGCGKDALGVWLHPRMMSKWGRFWSRCSSNETALISPDGAIEIARRHCETTGWHWTDNFEIRDVGEMYFVYPHGATIGGNVYVRVSKTTGEVMGTHSSGR